MSPDPGVRELPGGQLPAPSRLVVEPTHEGLRADAVLALSLPGLSQTRVRQKIQTGESLLNGRRYATSARLAVGDIVTVSWRNRPSFVPCRQFEILFQDEQIIALNKPAGVASHPAGKFQTDTVIQFVRELLAPEIQKSLATAGGAWALTRTASTPHGRRVWSTTKDFLPRLVGRLDVFTSGVILVAMTGCTLRRMHAMAANGSITKRYLALVEGVVDKDTLRIEIPLGPDPQSATRLRMAPQKNGLPSITECVVLRRLPCHTLLSVIPRSGRQHQIRAHLSAIGHPVWGDLLYKDESLFLDYQRARAGVSDGRGDDRGMGHPFPPRHCLHAEEAEFVHPLTGERILIRSAMPADFTSIVSSLEFRLPG